MRCQPARGRGWGGGGDAAVATAAEEECEETGEVWGDEGCGNGGGAESWHVVGSTHKVDSGRAHVVQLALG